METESGRGHTQSRQGPGDRAGGGHTQSRQGSGDRVRERSYTE